MKSASKQFVLAIMLCAAMAVAAQAQTFNLLYQFDGSDGIAPYYNLTQGPDGNYYGTTTGVPPIQGTVFQLTPGGVFTNLYTFCSSRTCSDGRQPSSPLTVGADGQLYGLTAGGGANGDHGTVFKISPAGALTTVYSFCSASNCTDGDGPSGTLFLASDGNFYGTTGAGGTANMGTIFKITPSGVASTLYSFCSLKNCADGVGPNSGVIEARHGYFYGTTYANNGTLFRLNPSGHLTTLHTWCSLPNCADPPPRTGVVQGYDGNFYGVTDNGGALQGGTVYRITPTGTFTTLYSFCETKCTTGTFPVGQLIQGTDGKLYGTTQEGGFNGRGTVFRITTGGVYTRLHSFKNTDGALPFAGMMQATTGTYYGAARDGGNLTLPVCRPFGCGTLFNVTTPEAPFVKSVQSGGTAGNSVMILGYSLTGTTAVSFHGIAATTFSVVSDTEITATVPAGATTGKIQVVTPGGTLTSNAAFQVF